MGWFCLVCPLFIFLSSPLLIFSNEDRLTLGVSISGNQTMISAGGTFALGFFSPGNSTNQYLGIWYNKIAPQTVVWVANREVPLMNNSTGTFMLSDEGNLVVFHGSRKNVIWSSNVSLAVVTGNNSVGLLTDKGNLILTDIEEGNVLWESFNYPSDTILPGMKFGLNLINGHNDRLISWNKVDDPAAGVFSFTIDPRGPVQMLIWKTSDIYARTKPWNGSYTLTYSDNAHNYATIATFNVTDEGYYFGFSVSDESLILRFMLDRDGKMKLLAWLNTKKWLLVWSFPTAECELYDRCGPSGLCDNTTSICGCLKGFRPFSQKDWEMGNHSAGCVREDGQICDNRDGFKSFKKIKLPDNSISLPGNLSHRECENQCLRNCSCTAYVYANTGSGFTSSCLNWNGKLMDLSTFDTEERDIYFRLPGAELFGSGKIHKTTHTFTIAATTVAVGILLIGAAACYVLWRWMGRREEANTSEINRMVYKTPRSPNKDTELFSFSLNSILAATNHFSMANKLGEGGFGSVFKGNLPDGEEIAIKRLSKMSGQGIEELMNELTLISKLQHMNLVRLVGCCIEGEEKMLIYEYMPNKSLDTFLFDPTKQVTFEWNERFHILEGVAQGLLYLHKYSRVKIIHRDLKASNILLDGAMNPKISDFGMARIFGGNQSQANTQRVVGTYGYMSPEYALNGRFSEKSDVYSFGVLLIEIVTSKKNSGFYPSEDSMSLLVYAWQLWKEDRVAELMDASIRHSLISLDEVAKCIHIGLLCVQENANHRPTMSSVVSMLGNETVALPAPQAPTFFTRICMTTVVASSSSNYSINELVKRYTFQVFKAHSILPRLYVQ